MLFKCCFNNFGFRVINNAIGRRRTRTINSFSSTTCTTATTALRCRWLFTNAIIILWYRTNLSLKFKSKWFYVRNTSIRRDSKTVIDVVLLSRKLFILKWDCAASSFKEFHFFLLFQLINFTNFFVWYLSNRILFSRPKNLLGLFEIRYTIWLHACST